MQSWPPQTCWLRPRNERRKASRCHKTCKEPRSEKRETLSKAIKREVDTAGAGEGDTNLHKSRLCVYNNKGQQKSQTGCRDAILPRSLLQDFVSGCGLKRTHESPTAGRVVAERKPVFCRQLQNCSPATKLQIEASSSSSFALCLARAEARVTAGFGCLCL